MIESLFVSAIKQLAELIWKRFVEPELRRRLGERADEPAIESTGSDATASIEARIGKIDAAQRSLAEAVEAMAEIHAMAEQNRAELAEALQSLAEAQKERVSAERELRAIKELAQADIAVFRKLAGVPSEIELAKQRFTERAIGFGLGVLASVIASLLWWAITKYVPALKS